MPISSTPMTALIAFIVMIVLQALPNTPEIKTIEEGAGLYALLFIIFKELIGLVKWFRKDPIDTKLSIASDAINDLTVSIAQLIAKVTEIETSRGERVAEMKPAIVDMQKGIAILVDRQKFTDASNAQRREHEHTT